MQLYGNYLSPYTRRVAVTLNLLELPFELVGLMVFKEPEKVRPHNPLSRIPTLVLDDGAPLVESGAILDEIDQMAGPARALTPAGGVERRRVMQVTAVAVGCMEKAQMSFYEGRFRPPEKVHEPWRQHNDERALAGLTYLDGLAGEAGPDGWLAGTGEMTQADVSASIAATFVQAVRPGLDVQKACPSLAAFTARCEALEAFASAPLPPVQ